MKVTVLGGDARALRPAFVEEAVRFFASELMDEDTREALDLTFMWMDEIGVSGYTEAYKGLNDPAPPKEFDLVVDPGYCDEPILNVIAHEMVHVSQYASGRLWFNGCGTQLWQGKRFYTQDGITDPWEIEAYTSEKALVEKFLNFKR